MKKRALITGITGQDGSYLAELLLDKGYDVYGFVRRNSADQFQNIRPLVEGKKIWILYGDLRDISSIERALETAKPDEIYNLAAQTHVGVSFKIPEETEEINYFGVGRLVTHALENNPKVKIYQASTSEMFGSSQPPQHEATLMQPVSPYARAKLNAYRDFIVAKREQYNAFLTSGILFNHESARRGTEFVTRKITLALPRIKYGLQDVLELGNLNAKRDWGHAPDYVEAMYLMMQQETPDDYVIASGQYHTVRDFVDAAATALGMKLAWEGEGLDERAKDESGKVIIRVNPEFFRPVETNDLLGDWSKAKKKLNWEPKTSFNDLVRLMAEYDEHIARTEAASRGKK